MADMANGIRVGIGAAIMFASALALFIVLFFVAAGLRHYLIIIGMLCVWLAAAASVLSPGF